MPKAKSTNPSPWHQHVRKYMKDNPNVTSYAVASGLASASWTPTGRPSRALSDAQKATRKIAGLKKKFGLTCTKDK